MKIHHFINDIDLKNGGAQKIVRMLHAALPARGIESCVVTLTGSASGVSACHEFRLSQVRDPRAVFRIARYLKKQGSVDDIIHVHLFPANLFVSVAVRLIHWKGKMVCTEHSTSNRRRGTWLGRCIDSMIYPPFCRIACISQATRDALSKWVPAFRDRMVVVENGAELRCSEFVKREPPAVPVIVSVGRLQALKNYGAALQAMALHKDIRFEYWIAGEGPLLDHLKSQATQLGLAGNVKFLGFVEDVPGLLRKADVFLMPSKWEGFGLSAVEAMNAGLPCVVSDVEGLREVVSDDCAFRIPPERVDLFADALRTLMTDSALREQMGRHAFERSFEFSAAAMVDRYMEFYEDVLNDESH